MAELGDTDVTVAGGAAPLFVTHAAAARRSRRWSPRYELGQEVATREAYGAALAALARSSPQVVALDGDTKNSTFSEKFKEVAPERFVEGYIAEQNMVGAALGISTEGKIPFASTFAAFFTRAYDFIRMADVLAPVAPGAGAAATPASPSAKTARRRWRSKTWP